MPEIAVQVKMAESLTLTLVDMSISTEKVTLVVMRMNDYENDEKCDVKTSLTFCPPTSMSMVEGSLGGSWQYGMLKFSS